MTNKASKFQLVGEIITLATIITNISNMDVFVDYAGHVNEVEVQVWENGWKSGTLPEKSVRCYLNKGGAERELQTCKEWLMDYLVRQSQLKTMEGEIVDENRKNIARVGD